MNSIFDKFIEIRPVVIEGEPEAHSVHFKVGVQSFCISPHGCGNKEHAEWLASMFNKALTNMLEESGALSPPAPAQGLLPCPFCGAPVHHDLYGMNSCSSTDCNLYWMRPMTDEQWNTRNTHGQPQGWKATDQQIQDWADRHDMNIGFPDLRAAFEDAQTLPPPPTPPHRSMDLKAPKMTGPQFKAARERLGKSRDELALLLGVSATTIWRLEQTRGRILSLHSCAMAYLLAQQAPIESGGGQQEHDCIMREITHSS